MKIVFFLASLGSGGAERVSCTVANYLSDRGFDVIILTLLDTKCAYQLNDNIRIGHLSGRGKRDDMKVLGLLRHLKRYRSFLECVKREKPDVIISMLNLPIYISLLAKNKIKVPVLISERGDPFTLYTKPGIHRLMVNWLYPKADKIVFQTRNAADYFGNIPSSKKTVIPNPLSKNFINVPCRLGKRGKDIVAVGRLNKAKNYPLLLEAFSKLNPGGSTVLRIYGEGELESELKDLTEKLGLSDRVRFMGFCESIEKQITGAGCYVLSSDHEGMPNALIEAMALGLPCVSTDCPCGAPREMIRNGENGLLVPCGDANALQRAIASVLGDEDFASRLGENARKAAATFMPDVINPQWESILFDLIRRKKRQI